MYAEIVYFNERKRSARKADRGLPDWIIIHISPWEQSLPRRTDHGNVFDDLISVNLEVSRNFYVANCSLHLIFNPLLSTSF